MTITTTVSPLERAQEDVDWLTGLWEGLQDGTKSWRDWRDDLTCPDRTEVAREESWTALRLAQEELAQLTGTGEAR